MGFFDRVKSFLGFDDEDKKKKQQPQQNRSNNSRPQNNRSNAPRPSTMVLPTQRQNDPKKQQEAQKKPDNTISLVKGPELPEVLKKAAPKPAAPPKAGNYDPTAVINKKPAGPRQMGNAEIAARSAGATATNLTGGLIGAVKGIAELPSAILQAPKLVKVGAAKVTKNKVAEENAVKSDGLLDRAAERYNSWVAPVTKPLEKLEKATDDAAANIAPWSTGAGKTLSKVAANLVPVDAAVGAIAGASKAAKTARVAEIADGAPTLPVKADPAPGLSSVNPNRTADALKQGEADAAALPPAPHMDPELQAPLLDDPLAASLRKVPAQPATEVPGQIPVRQPVVPDPNIVPPVAPMDNAPAFMRRGEPNPQAAADEAYLAREREFDANNPTNDDPAFLRRLDTPERVNDQLHSNATNFTRNPDFAEVVQEAYRATGSDNPLSIAAAALSRTQDKGRVRAILENLVPGIEGNTLNRAVNQVVGAEDQVDVLDALHTATVRTHENAIQPKPFGPVSDAPVAPPAPAVVDEVVPPRGEVGRVEPVDVVPGAENKQYIPATFDNTPADTLTKSKNVNTPPAKTDAANTTVPSKIDNTKEVAAPEKTPSKVNIDEKPKKTAQKDLAPAKVTKAADSGETGKSKGKYSRGQEYEKTSNEASHKRGSDGAANTDLESFTNKIEDAGGMNGADRDVAVKLQERFKAGSEEHRLLGDLINKYHTNAAQALATIDRVIRKTADANKLTDRFVSRLYKSTDDNINFTDKDFDEVIAKNEAFVKARDDQNAAIEAFNKDPSDANANAVADAFKQTDEADRAAKFQEYKTASRLGKGSKNPTTKAYIQKLEKDAGVYTMDWVDASMLSSSRVMINNFINTLGVRVEEALFGRAGAALARRLSGGIVGGGSNKGSRLGAKLGSKHWRSDAALRQGANENALTKTIKNFTTTGNTVGDRNTYAAAYGGVFDHYKAKLRKEGFKGDELDRRAMVNSLSDPDNIVYDYMNQALAANAMASITSGARVAGKIETQLADVMAHATGNSAIAKAASKALVRVAIGFPTVIGRSLVQGAKRATAPVFGGTSTIKALHNIYTKGPKEVTALHFKNAIKEAGSGATMYAVGFGLGSAGIITGGYPSDKAERDRWKREGISENSIRIGKDYYSLPAALGVFALPFMIGANAASNIQEGKKLTDNFIQDTMRTIINATPVDGIAQTTKLMSDLEQGKDVTKQLATYAAGLTRALQPLGSLTNQVAKMFDPTANDTTQGDFLAQFVHKVQDGIPGLANDLPAKTVDGKEIKNPSAIPKFFGAVSTSQSDGVEKTSQMKAEITGQTKTLKDAGVLDDKIRAILDDDTKAIFDNAKNGKDVTPEEMKKLQSGITKGVTETEDTRFLEDGDYDHNLAVLRTKKALLEKDPTTRRETLDAYDEQIKRGTIYKDQRTPYTTVKKYKDIDLTEWRNLGDPDSDDYDPDLYEALFDLDAAMTDAGVSRRSADKTKPKYYAKASKSGSGGGGGHSGGKSDATKAADADLKRIQGNTVDSVPDLKKIDLSDLAPKKMQAERIPKIQQIRSSDLIKKRKITIGKA